MPVLDRASVLSRLHKIIANGGYVLGGGAGNGLSAKAQEAGGIDLLVIYNSGRYRMAGRGSLAGLLAYGNANQIVREMAPEIVTAVAHTPVIAGVNGTDPFLQYNTMFAELKARGIVGVQNFPTVGLIDGLFRQNLEETGMSYQLEVELIAAAAHSDLLTTPYVFSAADAEAMAQAGADVIVCHLGLTTGGTVGAETTLSLKDCVPLVTAWSTAARAVKPNVIVLCHGGPIATASDAAYVLGAADGVHGFYGASSMERLPVERSIAANVKEFRDAIADATQA